MFLNMTSVEQQRREKQEQLEALRKNMATLARTQTYTKDNVYPFLTREFEQHGGGASSSSARDDVRRLSL